MRKTILSVFLILTLAFAWIPSFAASTPASLTAVNTYTDIKGHWAEKAIVSYAEQAIFADSTGKFLPSKSITRSEFVLMLHKALGISIQYFKAIDIKEYFSDVNNGDRYAYALYDLATLGIIDYRGTFRPNETLPRDEMVHIIINALKNKLGGTLPVNTKMPIILRDDAQISAAFKSDVYRALLLNLIYGRGNNQFDPKTRTTRAESAVMMERLVAAVKRLTPKVGVAASAVPGQIGLLMKYE